MLSSKNFDEIVIQSGSTAMIVFTAEWCRPCKLQKDTIAKIRETLSDQKILIETIDVDDNEELANRYSARTLPTTVLFSGGQIVEILAGYQSEDFLVSYIQHIEKMVAAVSELDPAQK